MATASSPLQPATLPRTPEPFGQNAAALYTEGLEHLRRLAGQTWTDHNIHDPGITTLELVTWAQAVVTMDCARLPPTVDEVLKAEAMKSSVPVPRKALRSSTPACHE